MIPRHLMPWVQELLTVSPVVVVEGARQTGKSTLLRMLGGDDTLHLTMDDDVTRAFAQDDPVGLLRSGGQRRLVIDEVQRCPELVLPLKAEVDRDRRPGRFLLTGSANLLRVPGAEDSLAGRAMTARLHPLSQGELLRRKEDWVTKVIEGRDLAVDPPSREAMAEMVCVGGYPTAQGLTHRVRSAWLEDYATRLVQRDASDVARVDPILLGRLLRLLAAAPGAELVLERLAQALGVARATVARYLDVLEALFLIQLVPSWSRNLTKRQVNRGKCFLVDSGLAAVLSGLSSEHLTSPHGADHLGGLVENFVAGELTRQSGWSATRYELSHYRDRNGAEVDFVIETPRGVIGVEVKTASAATGAHFRHLVDMRDRLGSEFLAGIVLHFGPAAKAGDRLQALPVASLWSPACDAHTA